MKCPYCKCEHPEGGQHFINVIDADTGEAVDNAEINVKVRGHDEYTLPIPVQNVAWGSTWEADGLENAEAEVAELGITDKYWENQRLIDELQEYSAGLEYVVNQQGGE